MPDDDDELWEDEDEDELDDDDDEDEDDEEDEDLEDVAGVPGIDDDLREYQPHIGPAPDPFEDRPEARRIALAPLLAHDGAESSLAPASLRFLRGTGEEKLDFLLSLTQPKQVIQAMSAEEFVLLAKDIGMNDASSLLALASPRQLQACVDLDAWTAGELDTKRVGEWLQVAMEAGRSAAQRFVAAQEDGVWTLYLAHSLHAMDRSEEYDNDIPDDREVFNSPDGAMLLIAELDDPELPNIRMLLELAYRQSQPRGRTLLRALKWELPAQLEEDLYHLRNARLEECGFLERDEAREMYLFEDPFAVREQLRAAWRGTGARHEGELRPYLPETEPVRLGLALPSALDQAFLPEVMAKLAEAERERVRVALVRLAYRVQAARAEKPSDVEQLPQWSRHAMHTLAMGLEFATDDDADYAALLLTVVPVLELFRLGHSLVVLEHHRARRLRTSLGGEAGLALLTEADKALVHALVQSFPGLAVADGRAVPIDGLRQLGEVRTRMQGLQATVRLVEQLADAPLPKVVAAMKASDRGEVTLHTLLATALARHVLGLEPGIEPLAVAQLQQFLRTCIVAGKVRAELRQAAVTALLAQPDIADDEATALAWFAEAALDRVGEELGGLDPDRPFDLRFVGASILVAA